MNKITRQKDKNYTTISNVFLRDQSLSLKAKGLLAVVMGLPDDWEFSINGICAILKEGKSAVYTAISELKALGYCKVTNCKDDSGKFLGNDYTFIENPYAEKPHTENPYTENQPQLNKDIINNVSNKEKESLKKKSEPISLDLPYGSAKFKETWDTLSQMPKWKKKSLSALQMSLKKLSKYDEPFAIELMESAIAGEYQGIVFSNTDQKYEEWKRKKNAPRFQSQDKRSNDFQDMIQLGKELGIGGLDIYSKQDSFIDTNIDEQ